MIKFELTINNTENIGHLSEMQRRNILEIMTALVQSGGLTGVKGGKTIIHFDGDGIFRGIELDYWPWKKRNT